MNETVFVKRTYADWQSRRRVSTNRANAFQARALKPANPPFEVIHSPREGTMRQ